MTFIETVPLIDLTPNQIDNLLEELRDYHHIYSPLFTRREQSQWAEKYMQGLLLNIPRQSIEPMILALEGANPNRVRAMQHFASEGAWKDNLLSAEDSILLKQHWREVNKDIGDPAGVLIVDGSDFPKQGNDSVGVARQYCGQLGKVANCQAGVFLGYASRKGYTLLDRRLYLTEEWVQDKSYQKRLKQCGVPEDITFQTKQTLALEMIKTVQQEGCLCFNWVMCDASFGRDTAFLDAVASLSVWYYAQVPHDTQTLGCNVRRHLSPPGREGDGYPPVSGWSKENLWHRRLLKSQKLWKVVPGRVT